MNQLITWTREAMRRLERISEFETEYDLQVPLTRALFQGGTPLVARNEFDLSVRNKGLVNGALVPDGDGRLTFNLKELFPFESAVRLRSVGLSYVRNSEDDQFIKGNRRLRCVLFTPEQVPFTPDPVPDTVPPPPFRRPPVVLNNVGERLVEHAEVTLESGPTVYNVDPRGEWTLLIHPRAHSSAGFKTQELELRQILLFGADVVLHLRVRSLPKVKPDEWSTQ